MRVESARGRSDFSHRRFYPIRPSSAEAKSASRIRLSRTPDVSDTTTCLQVGQSIQLSRREMNNHRDNESGYRSGEQKPDPSARAKSDRAVADKMPGRQETEPDWFDEEQCCYIRSSN